MDHEEHEEHEGGGHEEGINLPFFALFVVDYLILLRDLLSS
jgi:hypothetical protein